MIWQPASEFLDFIQVFFPGVTPPAPVAVLIAYAYLAAAFFCGFLTAKIWQDIRKVFETSAGQTRASIGPTPFQGETVRLLKKIAGYAVILALINLGVYLIPILTLAFRGGGAGALSSGILEILSCFATLVFGLAVFCLAHFFAYGIQLQLDTDGLV